MAGCIACIYLKRKIHQYAITPTVFKLYKTKKEYSILMGLGISCIFLCMTPLDTFLSSFSVKIKFFVSQTNNKYIKTTIYSRTIFFCIKLLPLTRK